MLWTGVGGTIERSVVGELYSNGALDAWYQIAVVVISRITVSDDVYCCHGLGSPSIPCSTIMHETPALPKGSDHIPP